MRFAGNYFGGEVETEARKIWDVPAFQKTIWSGGWISMVANGDGTMSGGNAPLSEYAVVSRVQNPCSGVSKL